MRSILVAAIVLSAAMAGCADRADAISARDGLGPAREAAAAHGSDPVLISISSIEPFRHMAEEDYEVWIHLDKNPGDGLAPGWLYTFVSGDRHIGILYAAGLGVIAEGYEVVDEDEMAYAAPLTSWALDSTDVARVLATHDGWPAASDDTTVFWSLQQHEDGPMWFVEWANATLATEAMIDAQTGNVSQVESWIYREASSFTCSQTIDNGGMIHPLQSASLSIDVSDGGLLEYMYSWSMTVGDATMTISGPDGDIISDTIAGNGRAEGAIDDLAGGTYTLEIGAELGAGQVPAISLWTCG